jgi:DNA ligase-1
MRPMLAAKIRNIREDVCFPILATPKLDGIRCLILNGRALTRALKPVPNKFVREYLEDMAEGDDWNGLDGELMLPPPYTFQDCDSAFMSHNEPPPKGWYFAVFDRMPDPTGAVGGKRANSCAINKTIPAAERIRRLIERPPGGRARVVAPYIMRSREELLEFEEDCLELGFEGVMLRSIGGPYKHGRATLNEGWLMKLKRWSDSEARIVGFVPGYHNTNVATVSETGLTKRSSAKAGKQELETLGAFIVRDLYSGVKFKVGTGDGLTPALKKKFWSMRDELLGRVIKYKHFAQSGVKEKPRHPKWLGFRSAEDMDEVPYDSEDM